MPDGATALADNSAFATRDLRSSRRDETNIVMPGPEPGIYRSGRFEGVDGSPGSSRQTTILLLLSYEVDVGNFIPFLYGSVSQ